jgi:hypothetical protein
MNWADKLISTSRTTFYLQKTWIDCGYGSAFAPEGAIGTREENFIADSSRIEVIGPEGGYKPPCRYVIWFGLHNEDALQIRPRPWVRQAVFVEGSRELRGQQIFEWEWKVQQPEEPINQAASNGKAAVVA